MFTNYQYQLYDSYSYPRWMRSIKLLSVKYGYTGTAGYNPDFLTTTCTSIITINTVAILGFFEVLKFREWLIFGFFTILFSRMGLPKAHILQWVVGFFEGLNFTNDQHPRNSWNLCTSKKPTIRYKAITSVAIYAY